MTRTANSSRVLLWTVGLLIGAGLLGPAPAEAGKWTRRAARLASCQSPKTLIRLDKKTCQPTKFRPPLVVARACCANRAGKRRCHPFPICPAHSPS